jgi:hypothetical protein
MRLLNFVALSLFAVSVHRPPADESDPDAARADQRTFARAREDKDKEGRS